MAIPQAAAVHTPAVVALAAAEATAAAVEVAAEATAVAVVEVAAEATAAVAAVVGTTRFMEFQQKELLRQAEWLFLLPGTSIGTRTLQR